MEHFVRETYFQDEGATIPFEASTECAGNARPNVASERWRRAENASLKNRALFGGGCATNVLACVSTRSVHIFKPAQVIMTTFVYTHIKLTHICIHTNAREHMYTCQKLALICKWP